MSDILQPYCIIVPADAPAYVTGCVPSDCEPQDTQAFEAYEVMFWALAELGKKGHLIKMAWREGDEEELYRYDPEFDIFNRVSRQVSDEWVSSGGPVSKALFFDPHNLAHVVVYAEVKASEAVNADGE